MYAAMYPDPHGRPVLVYRWIVFLLAAEYVIYQVFWAADYSVPGGPFRLLTIWALMASFFCASRMLAYSDLRSDRRWAVAAAITAVLNAQVVILYWKLWLADPALVNTNGPIVWHQEYYLHALGPLLQWIDALFILGAFGRLRWAVAGLLVLVAVYVGWIELVVQTLSTHPSGSVTSGLPYPFLNDMEGAARVHFYATTALGGVAILLGFAALQQMRQRVFSRRAASPSR